MNTPEGGPMRTEIPDYPCGTEPSFYGAPNAISTMPLNPDHSTWLLCVSDLKRQYGVFNVLPDGSIKEPEPLGVQPEGALKNICGPWPDHPRPTGVSDAA